LLYAKGYDKVKINSTENFISASIEDNTCRWNLQGINKALNVLSEKDKLCTDIDLYILKRGLPYIRIKSNMDSYEVYSGFDSKEYKKKFNYSLNRSNSIRFDIIAYPQFAYVSTNLEKIYEIEFNFAPALEIYLWKGMKFTSQVIFPIIDEFYKNYLIRPGFLTLSQLIRSTHGILSEIVIGKFNNYRYGIDVNSGYYINDKYYISINSGYTGYTALINDTLHYSKINTFTGSLSASTFYDKYNLRIDLSYSLYLFQDHGLRLDLTRYFKDISIGFYCMYTECLNGGFHFTLPLSHGKRNKNRLINISVAKYFDLEYNAGTEFYNGQYYENSPNINRSSDYINPKYIKNHINE